MQVSRREFLKLSTLVAGILAGSKLIRISQPQAVSFSHTIASGNKAVLMLAGKGVIDIPTFDGRAMTMLDSHQGWDCWYTEIESAGGKTGSIQAILSPEEAGMAAVSIGYGIEGKGTIVFSEANTSSYVQEDPC